MGWVTLNDEFPERKVQGGGREVCDGLAMVELLLKLPGTPMTLRTLGIQALFDLARPLVALAVEKRDVRVEHFKAKLAKASKIDFSHQQFANASGAGRTKIRQCLEFAVGLAEAMDNEEAFQFYTRVLRS